MAFRTSNRIYTLFFLSVLGLIVETDAANFDENPCQGGTQSYVTNLIANELEGITSQRLQELVITADRMADRAFTKTWATHLSDSEYLNINFERGPIKADQSRFGYPEGSVSGGYGTGTLAQNIPTQFRRWEFRSRHNAAWALAYMLKIAGSIDNFIDHLPIPAAKNECGKPHAFHATHAEIKLFTKLKQDGVLPPGSQLLISVSRHMCQNCRAIFSHLARNGRLRIALGSPRKGRGGGAQLFQPEYVIFYPDGSYKSYKRQTAEGVYSCSQTRMVAPFPAGIDSDPIEPDPAVIPIILREVKKNGNMSRIVRKDSEKASDDLEVQTSSRAVCDRGLDGPSEECFSIFGGNLPKAVGCDRPGTTTGIHGTFGENSDDWKIIVLKSIGIFCDESNRKPAMGRGGNLKFERKCPRGYQMTGIHGRFGTLVDKVGIICRRISDGKYWASSLAGFSNGGKDREKECDVGYAGRTLKMWFGDSIDGLGLCCR